MQNQAIQYQEKINSIKNQFFAALTDFKKYYVYYNKNPEVNEFQNYYINSKSQLQNMSKDLFLVTNDIDKAIDSLNEQMKIMDSDLEKEKIKNKKLLEIYNNLKKSQNSSVLLIEDAKLLYLKQYYYNWEMIIGILLLSGSLIFAFKK
jgi:hypothetical protein